MIRWADKLNPEGYTKREWAWILFGVVAVWWPLWTLQSVISFDASEHYVLLRHLSAEAWRDGAIPFWNAFNNCGQPLCGDPASGAWYWPAMLIGLVTTYGFSSINLEVFLHLLIGAAGMRHFLKQHHIGTLPRIMGAWSWAMSGFIAGNIQHTNFMVTAAWLPWLFFFWFQLKNNPSFKNALGLGFVLSMHLCGGYPPMVFFLVYALGFYAVMALFSKPSTTWFLFLFLSVAVSALLSAGLISSMYEVWPHINRTQGLSLAKTHLNPFDPSSLVTMVFPQWSSNANGRFATDISMSPLFIGWFWVMPFFAFWLNKKNWTGQYVFFALLFVFTFFLALGPYTPVQGWLYHLPFFNLFRHLAFFRVLLLFLVIVMGAIGYAQSGFWLNKKSIVVLIGLAVLSFIVVKFKPGAEQIGLKEGLATGLVFAGVVFTWYWLERKKYSLMLAILGLGILAFGVHSVIKYTGIVYTTTALKEDAKLAQALAIPIDPQMKLVEPTYNPLGIHTWRGANVWYKKVSYGSYNPFELRVAADWIRSEAFASDTAATFIHLPNGKVESLQWEPYGFMAIVNLDSAAKLRVLQNHLPQTKVKTNWGKEWKEVSLYPNLGNRIEIQLPSGKHALAVLWQPQTIKVGAAVQIATFVLLMLYFLTTFFISIRHARRVS
jgi:hypothetical protein